MRRWYGEMTAMPVSEGWEVDLYSRGRPHCPSCEWTVKGRGSTVRGCDGGEEEGPA